MNGLDFRPDPRLTKKEGFVLGLDVGLTGRTLLYDGGYLNYSLSETTTFNSRHDLWQRFQATSLCASNKVAFWSYLDFCISRKANQKLHRREAITLTDLSFSKYFSVDSDVAAKASVGFGTNATLNFKQEHIILGLEAGRLSIPVSSKVTLKISEPKTDFLSHAWGLDGILSTSVFGKIFETSISKHVYVNGKLMGVDRTDELTTIQFAYPFDQNVSLYFGYTANKSSIGYFDYSHPMLGLNIKSYVF